MASSKSLDVAMKNRNPSSQRKGIVPVDPLNPPSEDSIPSSTAEQEQKNEVGATQKPPYKQISFDARANYVKAIKQIALDTDRNEKDIYNEALQEYIEKHPRGI